MAQGKDNDIISEAEEILEEAADGQSAHDTDADTATAAHSNIAGADANAGAGQDAQAEADADADAQAEAEADADVEVEAEVEAPLEEQLAAAQAAEQEWQDKFMRLHAEWDTYRRRTNEQRAEEKTRATEGMVESLLPVLDDFERSIDYAQQNGEAGLLEGIKQVYTKLMEVLTKNGVEMIDPAGQAFDALEAQAVGKVEDPSVPDETVAEVYSKGYRMGTKVLRPAMVTVSTGGPVRPKEDDE